MGAFGWALTNPSSDSGYSYSFLLASSLPDFLSLLSVFFFLLTSCMAAFRPLPKPALMTTACAFQTREEGLCAPCGRFLDADPGSSRSLPRRSALRIRRHELQFLRDLLHQINISEQAGRAASHAHAEESKICTPAAHIRKATRHLHLHVYVCPPPLGGPRRKPVHLQPRPVYPSLSFLSTVRVQRALCR